MSASALWKCDWVFEHMEVTGTEYLFVGVQGLHIKLVTRFLCDSVNGQNQITSTDRQEIPASVHVLMHLHWCEDFDLPILPYWKVNIPGFRCNPYQHTSNLSWKCPTIDHKRWHYQHNLPSQLANNWLKVKHWWDASQGNPLLSRL